MGKKRNYNASSIKEENIVEDTVDEVVNETAEETVEEAVEEIVEDVAEEVVEDDFEPIIPEETIPFENIKNEIGLQATYEAPVIKEVSKPVKDESNSVRIFSPGELIMVMNSTSVYKIPNNDIVCGKISGSCYVSTGDIVNGRIRVAAQREDSVNKYLGYIDVNRIY